MKKISNKKIGAVCGVAALALIVGSTYSYFTDRANTEAEGVAGTVAISQSSIENSLLDEDGKNILNPGDMRILDYVIKNSGSKSIVVLDKIVLSSSVAMTKDGQAEYEIYNKADVIEVPGKGYQPKDDTVQPLQVRTMSEDGTQITYEPEQYVLNGNEDLGDDKREIEDGITTDTKTNEYVLVFKGAASNDFQNSTVKVEILSMAKQARNLDASDWTTVATQTATFGGAETAVVPTEDVITK